MSENTQNPENDAQGEGIQTPTPESTKPMPNYYFPPVSDSASEPISSAASFAPATPVPPAFGGQPAASTEAKRNRALPLVAVAVAAALIGGASGAGAALYFSNQNTVTAANNSVQGITINNSGEITGVTAVAAKASPSVVTISVASSSAAGTGSGVIISQDGYVITNNHVATLDGAASNVKISIQDNDGNIYNASIVGTDPTVDLAVLKIDSANMFTPIEWADSSKLNVGDVTVALGAPLGLAGTVTTGIISALNRSIQVASSAVPDTAASQAPSAQTPFDFWNFNFGQGNGGQSQAQPATTTATISIPVIQTDAAINPGNSGGALLDSKGRLIGINVAIASAGSSSSSAGNIGLGFALPSNLAKRVSAEIVASTKATHGVLGAQVSDAANKSGSTAVGAYIEKLTSGGAAEKAGIKAGDVVTYFNGVRVTGASDLTAQVRTAAGGSAATVTIIRDGKPQTITVNLGQL
jgi:putative serine protease PepD